MNDEVESGNEMEDETEKRKKKSVYRYIEGGIEIEIILGRLSLVG